MPNTIDNYASSLALTQMVILSGVYPSFDSYNDGITMGAIRTFAGNFAPGGTAQASGQVLSIQQNTALFSLLGWTYGGDGQSTFALPDLQAIAAIGDGQGPGLSPINVGQLVGSAGIDLNPAQLPGSVGGNSSPLDNYQPSLGLNYLIRTEGFFPSQGGGSSPLNIIGSVIEFAGDRVPGGYMEAAGQLLSIATNQVLFSLIGTTFGGDGQSTFALPDLRGRMIIGADSQSPVGQFDGQGSTVLTDAQLPVNMGGSGQLVDNREPTLALNYIIALNGIFPSQDSGSLDSLTPILGEVMAFAGNFAPSGWALAQGQLLPINQNQALFSLLGTTYGGDGRVNFALPDLSGRGVVGSGPSDPVGTELGNDAYAITSADIPALNYSGTGADDTLYGGDGNDTIGGLAGNDTIHGNAGNDLLSGGGGDDSIDGGAGNDVLNGGSGNDKLIGGDGDDTLVGGTGGDVLGGGIGTDRAQYNDATAGLTADLQSPGNNTGLAAGDSYFSIEDLFGSSHNDNLRGNAVSNHIWGADGNDVIFGRNGNDSLYGMDGNDTLVGGGGNDLLNGGSGTDRAQYNDATAGLTADLQVSANNTGFAGGDSYVSIEDLYGSNFDDTLRGNAGANNILGANGNDVILGRDGEDSLYGGNGNDTLIGQAGRDFLYGNGGNDTFVYQDITDSATNYLRDQIRDFSRVPT